jgi:hypothetical protein
LLVLDAHARADAVAEVRSDHGSHTDGRDCSTIVLEPERFSISAVTAAAKLNDAMPAIYGVESKRVPSDS